MRELTCNEMAVVSGADSDSLVIIDPIAAAQTFFFLLSVTDQEAFMRGSVVTGMLTGGIGGGVLGYGAVAASAGVGLGVLAGLAGAGVGAVVGGIAFKGGALVSTGIYNALMG